MKTIIILLLFAPSIISAEGIYKWQNNQGVIQYSSAPPAMVSASTIKKTPEILFTFIQNQNALQALSLQRTVGHRPPIIAKHCRRI
ncbi:MAG: DUF4124 domain-containing protein [Candidatus Endonucleobacter sp. (ex Gigantidas childressi)]|nr:DUF4124 domain-containing protein [Candidatus Endonucleobacter sp. (ex Gigantidas childressi)]